MQRIYLPNIVFTGELKITQKDLYHQLTRVMRARVGQRVIFFDGKYLIDYVYEICAIDKNSVVLVKKEEKDKTSSELLKRLSLHQALPNKLSKIELLVQKCTEIGYSQITFFVSERSHPIVISESKKERIQKISIEAVEQCGGNSIPNIIFLDAVNVGDKDKNTTKFVCHTDSEEAMQLSELRVGEDQKYEIYVGPEGGFSEKEIEYFENIGVQKIYFGARIMRLETVAPCVGFYLAQQE